MIKMLLKTDFIKDINSKFKKALAFVEDYEKNMEFLNNPEVFSNKRIIKPMVIGEIPTIALFAINEKMITKALSSANNVVINDDNVPLVDMCTLPDLDAVKDEEYKKQLISVEQEYLENGYTDFADEEEPLLDINNIDSLNYDDLKKIYELSNQNKDTKGKVLSKVLVQRGK